jgi:hypothetical protein
MNKDTIELIANLALALSFIVGLVFGIAQVQTATRDRRERLTLEALRNFQTAEFSGLMLFIRACKMPSTQDEMLALPVDQQVKILQLSQQMETLGMLVAEKFISIELVDKTLGSFVTTTWDKYKTFIIGIRERQPDPDPFLGEYFQWLAEHLNDRMQKKPRQPFYKTTVSHHRPHSISKKKPGHPAPKA